MRAVSSSIMAVLVVVALFWGNCFSCPEAVLAFATHQPTHQCCHKTKTAVPGCDTQNLQQFVKTDLGSHVPAMPTVALVTVPAPVVSADAPAPLILESPPPDLLSLHSVYRI